MPEFFLISFMGMSVLRVALFVLRLLNSFIVVTFNLKETKRQTRDIVLLYCNYARMDLYSMIAFISGSPVL